MHTRTAPSPLDQAMASSSAPDAPARAAIYAKLTLVALFWGGTFVAGRLLAGAMSPSQAAMGRFGVAAVLLVLLAWRYEGGLPRLDARQVATTFALGLTGIFAYNLCFFAALARMPAGRTALFVALTPIVTALLLAGLLRERMSATRWIGIGIALSGALLVIGRGHLLALFSDLRGTFGAGECYMLGAVASWSAYTIIGRHALKGLSPLAATTYATLWGLALLVGAHLLTPATGEGAGIGWQAAVAILYLGAIGTVVGFVWYYQGIRALGPARAAVFTNLVPVFGVLLAVGLLGETLSLSMLAGGALVIAGVALANRGAR